MSLLSPEQLATLSDRMNLFQPSGLNDDQRIDLTAGGRFVAIDTASPNERDDAIRVRRLSNASGYLVQIAIADAAQIPRDSHYVEEAMTVKTSIYRGKRVIQSLLSDVVLRQLELTPTLSPQRALVVEKQFDSYGVPTREADIYPAMINVETVNFGGFASSYLYDRGGLNNPIAMFHERFRETRPDLNGGAPMAMGGHKSNTMYGSDVNQDYMIIANLGVTETGLSHGIPLLHRRYPTVEAIWSQNGQVPMDKHNYLLGDAAPEGTPYVRASSPIREGVSLANHLLLGAHIAGEDADLIHAMAVDFHAKLEA